MPQYDPYLAGLSRQNVVAWKQLLGSLPQIEGFLEKLKKELNYYETTGIRSHTLEILRKALNSVPVTSVEAASKLRGNLSDEILEILLILRDHFSKEDDIGQK